MSVKKDKKSYLTLNVLSLLAENSYKNHVPYILPPKWERLLFLKALHQDRLILNKTSWTDILYIYIL